MLTIPTTIKSTPLGNMAFDLYSRLLDDNIIMLDDEVTDESASLCVAQLLYLSAKDDAKTSICTSTHLVAQYLQVLLSLIP